MCETLPLIIRALDMRYRELLDDAALLKREGNIKAHEAYTACADGVRQALQLISVCTPRAKLQQSTVNFWLSIKNLPEPELVRRLQEKIDASLPVLGGSIGKTRNRKIPVCAITHGNTNREVFRDPQGFCIVCGGEWPSDISEA